MVGRTHSEGELRARAARLVNEVVSEGRSLGDLMEAGREGLADRDAALLQNLVYGSLRHGPRLAWYLEQLVDRPLRRRDRIVGAVIMIGLYQLEYLRVPEHAAVSESVAAVRRLRRPRAAGMVNAVLRRFLRERESLREKALADSQARWMHPQWLIEQLRADWPRDWERILDAGNRQPPMCLRVNASRTSREDYLARLEAAGIGARAGGAPQSVLLAEPVPVDVLPDFGEGACSVQDDSAQWIPGLLDIRPGQRILDACAAPGGKTAHVLETLQAAHAAAGSDAGSGTGEVVAVDVDGARAGQIEDNLARLGLSAQIRVGDATRPDDWWDGRPFDRILVDAPCSATGVIRRHPDIKYLRGAADIAGRAKLQGRLLDAAWSMLAPGGRLVYVTCSVLQAENEAVVAGFLNRQGDARAAAFDLPATRPGRHGRQRLTGEGEGDGFYYACLERAAPE